MRRKYRIYILLSISFIFLVIIFCPLILKRLNINTLNDKALFGNMYGIVNALFSGLAFLGVIVSLFLQREDLRLTREELKLQRTELSRSAKAQEESEKASRNIAKLNGLSSLLDYSLNKKNKGYSPVDLTNIHEFLGEGEAENIKNNIKRIVDELK